MNVVKCWLDSFGFPQIMFVYTSPSSGLLLPLASVNKDTIMAESQHTHYFALFTVSFSSAGRPQVQLECPV